MEDAISDYNLEVFNSVGVGIALVDSKSLEIVKINNELQTLGNYASSQMVGDDFLAYFLEKEKKRVLDLFQLVPINDETLLSEENVRFVKKSGKPIHVNLILKMVPNTNLRLITIINAEPRRALEMELESAYQQMVQTSKFFSLAEMAAGIAHEINNPLAIIHAYVEQMQMLIEKKKLTDEKATQLCEKVLASTVRAANIIGTLKKLSQNDTSLELQNHNLLNILNEVVSLCNEKFKSSDTGLEFESEVEDDTQVLCNVSQLMQVFINLLENAFFAVKNAKTKKIVVQVLAKGNKILVRVSDTGPGVPKEIRDEIMTPFFTTKGVDEGTGLGLSISRSILKRHKGDLTYREKSQGACFEVSLPRLQEIDHTQTLQIEVDTKNVQSIQHPVTKPVAAYNILIVDDEKDLVSALVYGLQSAGHTVFQAENGDQALAVIKQQNIEVLVTDVKMPVMDGRELLQTLNMFMKNPPRVIFFTGSAGAGDNLLSQGAEVVLQKPISLNTILKHIESFEPKQRKQARLNFSTDQKVEYQFKRTDKPIHGLADISESGMYVRQSDGRPYVDTKLYFQLNLIHENSPIHINGEGVVKWVSDSKEGNKGQGFGVEFQNLNPNDKQLLKQILSQISGEKRQ